MDNYPKINSSKKITVKGWHKADFINFLRNTLIPDLRESGSDSMADDLEVAMWFILHPLEDFRRDK